MVLRVTTADESRAVIQRGRAGDRLAVDSRHCHSGGVSYHPVTVNLRELCDALAMAPRLMGRANPQIVHDVLTVLGHHLRNRPERAFATFEAITNRAGRDAEPSALRTRAPRLQRRHAEAQS